MRALRATGWDVIGVARRAERLAELDAETGSVSFAADLTDEADVAALAEHVASTGPLHALVHVAGGARGADRIEDGRADDWRWMFEVNVLSAQLLTAALLPLLREAAADDGHADTLYVTSTAAQVAYAGGGGYNAAKAGESMLTRALRLELNGEPIRVIEIAPGMVYTEEFTVNRLRGVRVKLTGQEGKGIGAVFARMTEDFTATLNGDFETAEDLAEKRMAELAGERDRRKHAEEGRRLAADRMVDLEERIEKALLTLGDLPGNWSDPAHRIADARRILRGEA